MSRAYAPRAARAAAAPSTVRVRTLANGVRVVTEPISTVRSCGVGLWLELGSRLETDEQAGFSHFIEHMLFKGTPRLNARAIADAINFLGGNVNAFTGQEVLCLHARTVDAKAHQALELLSELLLDSTFPEDEVARERQVVLEEYTMYEDNPDDLSVDQFIRNLWPGDPLGRPVLGTRRTIRRFARDPVMDYWRAQFRPERLVVAIAGAYDARACNEVIRRRLGTLALPGQAPPPSPPAVARRPRQTRLRKPIEQAHFCLGTVAPERRSPERFAFGMMNMVLGGGMSSRLFQEIREKRGLAYSIGSFSQLFSDRGFFAVSGGTAPATLDEVLRITLDEMRRMCDEEVPESELELARGQVIDGMLMGLENTESRMNRLAESLMAFGRVPTVEETIGRLRGVTPDHVREIARRVIGAAPLAACMIAPEAAAGRDSSGRGARDGLLKLS